MDLKPQRITMWNSPGLPLNGLGCDCQRLQLGAVSDYDVIIIGGQTYSANQILDKNLIAKNDTLIYHGDLKTPFRTVAAGNPIGRVYSYLRATGATGKNALMMYDNADYTGTPFYVLDESGGIDTSFLNDQGTLTVAAETKLQQDEAAKANDPAGYYLKKYGLPVLLIGGGIYLVAKLGSTLISSRAGSSAPAPAKPGIVHRIKHHLKEKGKAANNWLSKKVNTALSGEKKKRKGKKQ